jgi:hypothetical protein
MMRSIVFAIGRSCFPRFDRFMMVTGHTLFPVSAVRFEGGAIHRTQCECTRDQPERGSHILWYKSSEEPSKGLSQS